MLNNPALKGTSLQGKTGTSFFAAFLPKLIGVTLTIGVLIFFGVFLLGAIQWIMSGGDKQALEGARAKITNGIIGLVVLFIAFAVMQLIERFFGINVLTIDFGPLVIQ